MISKNLFFIIIFIHFFQYVTGSILTIFHFLGGNTDLRGFDKRFSRDLREKMPEHSPIINVRIDACGDHSWNTAYGAYTVPIPIPYGKYLLATYPIK